MYNMPHRMSDVFRYCLTVLFIITTSGGTFLSGQTPLVTGQVNKYAKITTVGTDNVVVDDVADFAAGDTVMVMQMSGVRINASTTLPGNYQNTVGSPGRYEILIVNSINTGAKQVFFSRNLLNTYSPQGKVQLVRVRSYRNAVVNAELTCLSYDSAAVRGGVLAFLVQGVLTLNADINVTGKGFRGGMAAQGAGYCQSSDDTIRYYSYSIYSKASGYKGDGLGIRNTSDQPLYPGLARGKGVNLTGGGGGNGHFSGGGGGSNYGAGREGDVEVTGCSGLYPGGNGGYSVSPTPLSGGVFMGGGGGASTWLTTASNSDGGGGGGIVIILADSIRGNGRLITATGIEPNANAVASSGAGGGGGGGSLVISARNYPTLPVLSASGGKGGNTINQNGAGGGGGGGLIWTNGVFPGTATVAGGLSGLNNGGDPDKDGYPGIIATNLKMPLNGFLFNAVYSSRTLTQIDSICEGTTPPRLTGTLPAGGSGTYTYQWQKSYDMISWSDVPGTGIDYTPASAETDTLWFRRVVNDGAGITDISKPVYIIVHPIITLNIVGTDTTICYNQNPEELYPLNTPGGGTGRYIYTWQESPDNLTWDDAAGVNTGSKYDPPALTSTIHYHRIINSGSCTDISAPVTVTVLPSITGNNILADQTICQGSAFSNLTGAVPGGGASPVYTYEWMSSTDQVAWNAAAGTNNGLNYDPQNDSPGTTYFRRVVYSGLNNTCQSVSAPVVLTCHPSITNNTIAAAQTICEGSAPAALDGSLPQNGAGAGTYTYQWMNSSNGTSYSNVSGATLEDFAGVPLAADTWYRRIVNSSVCTSTSNDIKITVDPTITGFDISLTGGGHDTICTGDTPALLDGIPGGGSGSFTYAWASSADNVTFTSLSATGRSYQSGPLSATTWFRRTVSSGTCTVVSVFKITVLPVITGNTIASNQTICNTVMPASLTGNTPGGGDGKFRYLWEKKETASPDWSPAAGTNNTASYQPPLLAGTTQFRRTVYSGEADCCSSVSQPVTVTVDIMPQNISAGEDRTLLPYQFAVRLEGSFDGDGIASWTYDYSNGEGEPQFSSPGEKVTDVTKLGFGENRFILSVTNGACKADDVDVTLTVPELTIPQGVTPNNDGINDYFDIEGLEYTYNELVIINTGGAVVYRAENYRSNDPVNAWTGLDLNGNQVPEGTYYYLLTIKGAQDMSVPEYVAHISGFIILRR
jgi:gliding motility-associated-like protein